MQVHLYFVSISLALGDDNESFWTSGTDLGDTVYYWLENGKKVNFTEWAPNQPDNNYGSNHCIGLWPKHTLKWAMYSCSEVARVMCDDSTRFAN